MPTRVARVEVTRFSREEAEALNEAADLLAEVIPTVLQKIKTKKEAERNARNR